jgi:hypothetical protein
MSYVHFTRSPGVSADQYHSVLTAVGDEPVAGRQSHWAGHHEGALCTVDVWESRADADRFAAERLFPAFEHAGVRPPADTVIVAFEALDPTGVTR